VHRWEQALHVGVLSRYIEGPAAGVAAGRASSHVGERLQTDWDCNGVMTSKLWCEMWI
jgi:hypothetical protein